MQVLRGPSTAQHPLSFRLVLDGGSRVGLGQVGAMWRSKKRAYQPLSPINPAPPSLCCAIWELSPAPVPCCLTQHPGRWGVGVCSKWNKTSQPFNHPVGQLLDHSFTQETCTECLQSARCCPRYCTSSTTMCQGKQM